MRSRNRSHAIFTGARGKSQMNRHGAPNQASAIAAGFDQSIHKVLTDLVAWVDAKGGA